jgi:hypothetical protein
VHGPVRLLPHAAFLFADLALSRRPEFAYGDHDQLTKEGCRHAPSFKPALSPELLSKRFYVGPCVLVRVTANRRTFLRRITADLRNNRCDELTDALLAAPLAPSPTPRSSSTASLAMRAVLRDARENNRRSPMRTGRRSASSSPPAIVSSFCATASRRIRDTPASSSKSSSSTTGR